MLGASAVTVSPTADQAGSVDQACDYKSGSGVVTTELKSPRSFAVDAQSEFNEMTASGQGGRRRVSLARPREPVTHQRRPEVPRARLDISLLESVKMLVDIHALVKHSHHVDHVAAGSVVERVRSNSVPPVAGADFVAGTSNHRVVHDAFDRTLDFPHVRLG
jgi:hypothetical protein